MAAIAYRPLRKQDSATTIFWGGRNIGWFCDWEVSLRQHRSEHIVGLAGGASTGSGVRITNCMRGSADARLGICAFYYQSGIFTMLVSERRFNATARGFCPRIVVRVRTDHRPR